MDGPEADASQSFSAMLDEWLASGEPAAEPPPAPAEPPPPADPAGALDAPSPAGSLLEAVSALERESPERDAPAGPGRPAAAPEEHDRYVLFTVAGGQYSVHQRFVTELDRVPKITLVPNVPAWVRGITNRRGDILSVVDMRTLLGLERLGASNGRMLVVRLLDDTCSIGLLVDDVQQIAGAPGGIRAPGPGLDGPLAPFLSGLFELDTRTVAVLDLDRLLRSPLLRQFDEPADASQG